MQKKQSNVSVSKVTSFLKRNIYYVMMVVCVLAIGAIITTVAVITTQDNSIDAGGNPPIVTPPIETPDPPVDPDPPVVERDFIITMPVIGGVVSGKFNDSELVADVTIGDYMTHQAVDISAPIGANVIAGFEGVVTSVTTDANEGTVITIDHGNGYISVYKLVDKAAVKKGDKVSDETIIGTVGAFAFESGQDSHVHYELSKDGKLIDPMQFVLVSDK